MKYLEFYCFKDCIVLGEGMRKMNDDLTEVFNQTNTQMLNIHQFVSISAIGYEFAKSYGCFNGCYELSGKPQNFILRCVNGGRCMTANNEKQLVEGRIQDFDAVSLYPSAMSVMDGVPKGLPKILEPNTSIDELMKYDQFFVEINIKSLKCKSDRPYKFGLVYKINEHGSKQWCNETNANVYIDKVGLKDLIEFYDIEFDVVRT